MVDWTAKYTKDKWEYNGREIHLQGLFRGFSIERKLGGTKEGPHYFFIGNPHEGGAYLASAGVWYGKLLKSIADRWANDGTPPIGSVNAPSGGPSSGKAHYRGTSMWLGD